MILKSYFDGGNEPDSTQYDVVTLASISGTTDQLRPFTQEWEAVLKKHKAPSVHTTYLVSRKKKPFRDEDGWSENQTNDLITDCIEVIKRHIALPLEDPSSRVGLLPFTVTIVLKDFLDARGDNPDVPKNAAEACAVQNAFGCLQWGADIMGADFYHFFFDQNEPYRGHICDRLQNPKAMKQLPLLQKITKLPPEDHQDSRRRFRKTPGAPNGRPLRVVRQPSQCSSLQMAPSGPKITQDEGTNRLQGSHKADSWRS